MAESNNIVDIVFEAAWFTYEDFYVKVAEHFARTDGLVCAEIGCFLGHSISFLAGELAARRSTAFELYGIDRWDSEFLFSHLGATGKQLFGLTDEDVERLRKEDDAFYRLYRGTLERKGVQHLIRDVRADSAEAASLFADKSFDFIFIDAGHSSEEIRRDLTAWRPKLKPGGWLAGHDYRKSSVKKVVRSILGDEVDVLGSVWYYRSADGDAY